MRDIVAAVKQDGHYNNVGEEQSAAGLNDTRDTTLLAIRRARTTNIVRIGRRDLIGIDEFGACRRSLALESLGHARIDKT